MPPNRMEDMQKAHSFTFFNLSRGYLCPSRGYARD